MKLNREEVLHIARLARLGLDEAEVGKFSEQLSNLLEHFEVLQQVDTTGVLPTARPVTVIRLSFILLAPAHCFRFPM